MDLIRTPNNSENGQVRAIIKKHLEINPFTEIVANGRKIIWTLPNENAWWRARNLLTAEVETIAWLDAFEPADTLLDVGANMGLYSLYAAQGGKPCLCLRTRVNELCPSQHQHLCKPALR